MKLFLVQVPPHSLIPGRTAFYVAALSLPETVPELPPSSPRVSHGPRNRSSAAPGLLYTLGPPRTVPSAQDPSATDSFPARGFPSRFFPLPLDFPCPLRVHHRRCLLCVLPVAPPRAQAAVQNLALHPLSLFIFPYFS